MGKHSPVAIEPKYMETFQCIGSNCEENCCHGWQVTIDKQTFKKYRTVEILELHDKLKNMVKISESSTSADSHAHIKLDANGFCPFLDEKNLCEIQGNLGSSYLSKTCQTYPRHNVRKNDEIWLYASLSCPEAARKALLDADAMNPILISLPYPNVHAVPIAASFRFSEKSPELLLALANYIYDVTFSIIRFSKFKSWEAMIVLGLMVHKINLFLDMKDPGDARALIVERLIKFTDLEYLAKAGELAQGIEVKRSKQISLLTGVLHIYFSKHHPRTTFRQTILDAMQGIHFNENDLEGSEKRYSEADEMWFTPFDEAHPHLLKNYLLNDIGKNSFPIGKNRGLETEFIDLAVRYSLIKMILIGIAGLKQEKFSEADYVRVIYMFSRNIEHNPTFMPELLTLLEQDSLKNIVATTLMMR
jgi:lysine-N-methylase